jgi:hypothetical protein
MYITGSNQEMTLKGQVARCGEEDNAYGVL